MAKKLKPEVKKRWLQALRSGKIKQAQGQLRTKDDAMCCLGVLCNLHAESHPEIAARQKLKEEYMGHHGLPPDLVLQWAFQDWNKTHASGVFVAGKTLSLWNDNGASFKQIADMIEKHL